MKKIISAFICLLFAWMSFTSCGTRKKQVRPVINRDSTFTDVIHPEWSRSAIIYEVNLRQYTPPGTIKDFEQQLPRLKELGVDILWFMPIHPISQLNRKGELGSYYAVKDYKAVNPEFGTIADFKTMVKDAHKLGFKVIIDWVPNHSGCDNAWVTEHPDWYAHDKNGKMFGPFDWTDVYKFNYSNPAMRNGMIDAMKFWIETADIDGFRCDVAGEVPTDFWNQARPQLDAVKPMFMLAEADKPDLNEKAFDMCYNWPMKDLFGQIAASQGENKRAGKGKNPIKKASSIDSLLNVQAKQFPKDAYMMNMITNHDLNSWEGTEFDRLGTGAKTFAVLTYTLPGMPLIYTGQEIGFNHAFEFFKKDVSPTWAENSYFDFYKKLNSLKHNCTAINAGEEGAPMVRYATASPDAYVFSRTDINGGVYVFVNLSKTRTELKYTGNAPQAKSPVDYFTGKAATFPTSLAPWEYKVFTVK